MATMHSLFTQVLVQKNLSKAGDLFSLEDDYVINDFSAAIKTIQNIITQPEFLTNHNDQSLVEICITRLVSAIRETRTIEAHAADLVALLENCLSYNLRPSAARGPGGGLGLDPPHAKIAGDVMSCIFLNYSKRDVMELALPVAVKFLHKGNKDLSRNMSSYLSLAAIENAGLLARHIQPIIDSVISGNYSLSRVLPTIYAATDEDRSRGGHSTINNHVMTLVSILPNCENTEKLALLSLFGLVAKENSALLEPSVPQLCESLTQQSTALSTLQVLHNMALVKPSILADHLEQVKEAAENFPKTTMSAVQVMCAVAKVRPDKAEETMDFILATICLLESEKHSIVLKEIVALVHRCPELLTARVVNKVSSLEEGASSAARSYIQELKNEFNSRQLSSAASREEMTRSSLTTEVAGGVTVVRVGGGASGSRTELSSSKPHLFQQMTPSKVENRGIGQATSGSRTKLDNKSGVSRVIPTGHRSMTKLNMSAATASVAAPGGAGVNKSMTRINASSQQNMARFSSSGQAMNSAASGVMSVAPYGVQSVHHGSGAGGGASGAVARSVTCISGASLLPGGHGSRSRVISSYGPRVSVSAVGGPGASSPTKSMSSGSMSGVAGGGGVVGIGPTLVPSEPNVAAAASGGREVLTVNVNQINQDLIRQVSTVLSQHGGDINGLLPPSSSTGASYSHIAASAQVAGGAYSSGAGPPGGGVPLMGSGSAAAAAAPLSLPSQASRRVAPYSSGPLPTMSASQPPSLGLPNAQQHNPSRDYGAQSYVQQQHHHHQQPPAEAAPSSSSASPRRPFSSSTLPSPRRRAAMEKRLKANPSAKADVNADVEGNEVDNEDDNRGLSGSADDVITRGENKNAGNANRMSVFEPYPMRDTVQHFCERHLAKIKSYMTSLMVKLPLPVKCTIEERKGRKHAKLHFACQEREGDHCLYKATFYAMKTRHPRTWIHLMFLALQARSSSAISTRESSVSALKNCWDILKCEDISFVTLVTGAFPSARDQDCLMHELRAHRFFDVFEYNGPRQHWGCFLCNHPDRAVDFLQESEPVIEGQLKEKKGGKWKIFKKWKSRYFTLSGAKLTYQETSGDTGMTKSLDVGSIRSVKVTREGRRNIPKAFEIFTHDRTFVLKAKDGSNAQQWVQCLSVAKAHSEAQDSNLRKLAYGGSLGRLNNHGRSALFQRASMANSNIALRTAV